MPAKKETLNNSESIHPVKTELSRSMSLIHVVMIGVGAMIGAGIFVLTGLAAGEAGPALILVFFLNGVVTLLTALSYAELGSCFPEAGGGYLWIKQALPQPNGFLSGWMSWFAHAVACSLYAVAFGAFATEILGLVPGFGFLENGAVHWTFVKGIAVFVTLLFAYVNYRGAEETGKAETVVTVVKIVIIVVFCASGLWAISTGGGNWKGSFSSFETFMPNNIGGIAVAMGLTFIAFEGYEIIAQCGEEVVNPKKNIPRSIFISVAIVVPIYIIVAFVAIAGVSIPEDYAGAATENWQYMGEMKELAMIRAAETFMPLGGILFLIGGLFSTMSALNATIYSSSRVSFAMGRDYNLPRAFARIHPKRKTPHMATILSALLVIAMAMLPIEHVASAADAMFLLLFVLVNIAVINLRRHRPELDRGFKVPLVPFIPLLAIVSNLALAGFLFWHYRLGVGITAGFIATGVLVYIFYSRHKEAEAKDIPTVYEESDTVVKPKYRVLTPIANPRSISGLMKLSRIIAAYKEAETMIVNVVKVPAQLPTSAAAELLDDAKELIAKARKVKLKKWAGKGKEGDTVTMLPETSIIKVSHNIPMAIADAVGDKDADLLVLGWRGGARRRNYFFGNVLDDTVFNAECDVAMMVRPSSRFLDKAKRIVVPVLVDLKHARLSLDVAFALSAYSGVPVEAIHVSTKHEIEHEEVAKAFNNGAKAFAGEVDLSGIKNRIIHAKNVYGTLLSEIKETDIVVIEGQHEGVFSRHFFGEIPERLAHKLENPVILTKEYPGHVVSWFQKFFGTRMPEPHS